jgi:hypothetical protein
VLRVGAGFTNEIALEESCGLRRGESAVDVGGEIARTRADVEDSHRLASVGGELTDDESPPVGLGRVPGR